MMQIPNEMSIVLSIMKVYFTVTSHLNQGKYLNNCFQLKKMSNQQITVCLKVELG